MIDHHLPEPPIEHRYCAYCGKKKRLTGELIHWPFHKEKEHGFNKPVSIGIGGPNDKVEPFSMWLYLCAWCRAIETKRKKKEHKT